MEFGNVLNWWSIIIPMNIRISICLWVLALLPLTTPICQSPSQLNGLCTACPSGQTLSFGFCLAPIPGCISQLSSSLCGQCGTGYTFNGWACSLGSSNTVSSSSNLDLYTDNGPDKRYELLDYYFKQKYAASLKDKISDIAKMISLSTTYGYIYALTYFNPYSNASPYYAEAIVDYFYNITQFSFSQSPPTTNTKSTLLWFMNRQVVVSNLPVLAPSLLNKVQQLTTNDYRLFFLDYSGRMEVIDVQRTPNPSSTAITFPTLTQLYYAINQNTVINYVFSEFPTLQMHTNYTASYYSLLDPNGNSLDYFKFIFDNQIVITVQVNGLTFSVYSYDEPNSVIANATPQLGGFLPLLTLTDPIYLSVYNYLIATYPFLQYKTVQEVRYQLVAGTNFLITFNAQPFSNDQYVALAYQPLTGSPTVTGLLKNGVDITSTPMTQPAGAYNYEADVRFKGLYNYFRNNLASTLGTLLPIYQVLYTPNPNGTYNYQVIYTSMESCQLQYSPSLPNPYLILSYSAMGILVPTTPSPSAQLAGSDLNRNALLSFLAQEKPSLFSSFLVVSISPVSNGVRNVDLLTLYGTYFARVLNNGIPILAGVSMTSTNLCSDLGPSEFTANPVVVSLSNYIQANYPAISGYSLQLVQGFMSGSNVNYRLLYSQGSTRYEFLMSYSSTLGKYIASKVNQYSGTGCDQSSVLLGGQCVRSCLAFTF